MPALIRALGSVRRPTQISQVPFDHDPGHYARLCEYRRNPSSGDLIDYALDMAYMELQPDLLRFLLSLLLRCWQSSLTDREYEVFVENFLPGLQGMVRGNSLTPKETKAVSEFMRLALLDRLDTETELNFATSQATAHDWIGALNSFATVFPEAQELFEEWWRLDTPGHAIAALQYLSALIYNEHENPIFAPWTPGRGGGPPTLWVNNSLASRKRWDGTNLSFFRQWLTPDRVIGTVAKAAEKLQATPHETVAAQIAEDALICRDVVEWKVSQLLVELAGR